ncbi:MAG: hypothetical protein EX271_12250 [Acidimicrobiales bacterium]|nr:MAG: hypothetical protein EX271_12250 [Acidimicrobiales bacterium]
MSVLARISGTFAVTMLLASASFNAFAGKIERGTVLADDYNKPVYGDREYQAYHKHQPRQTPRSLYHYK